MEFKVITPSEWLSSFPKNKMNAREVELFKQKTKLTQIVKIRKSVNFRPLYRDNISSYYIVGKKLIYLKD